jgi:hypothetical protein
MVLALIFHIHSVANCFTIPTILSCKLFLLLSCKLFHNSHNTQSCQITSKLFHNFYNVATIQNSSKLDFVFSLHYIASLYARICSSFLLCSLRSAPSFSFILGMKKAPTFVEAFSLVAWPGFEPRQTAPKTVVLPLHNQAIPMPFLEWIAKIGVGTKFSKFL